MRGRGNPSLTVATETKTQFRHRDFLILGFHFDKFLSLQLEHLRRCYRRETKAQHLFQHELNVQMSKHGATTTQQKPKPQQ